MAGLKGTFGRGVSAAALGRAVQRPPLNDARRSADDDCDTAGSAGPGPSRQPPRRPSPPPRPPRLCCGAASPPPAAALPSPARRRLEREGEKKNPSLSSPGPTRKSALFPQKPQLLRAANTSGGPPARTDVPLCGRPGAARPPLAALRRAEAVPGRSPPCAALSGAAGRWNPGAD